MKKMILIVEDDEDILNSLVEFVESEGFQSVSALNGKIALEVLNDLEILPAAIILDLMMPIMDGLEFRSRQLSIERIAQIPVVVVSADHQIDIKKKSMGAVESLRKPIDIDQLSAVLKKF
jgi:DNA-binding response OmpR family regulator